MSWISDLFKKKPEKARYAPSLNGWLPVFSQFGDDIYQSDVVVQALKCIVDEMKKLTPTHVRYVESDPMHIKGNVQEVLDSPNDLMTTSEFIEKVTWQLLMNYNAFIIPTYYTWTDDKTGAQRRHYDGLYPINPSQVDFIEDTSGRLYVSFTFWNGYQTTIAYDDVIHLKYNYSLNDYMGGDRSGQPDHEALLKTLELNSTLLQGVAKAMKSSYAVNGIVKYNTLLDSGATQQALKDLEDKLRNNESGFLPLDIKADFTPLEKKIALVDEPTLKFIDEKILRTWGIPLCILTGDYTKEQYESFYQKVLEPLVKNYSQAFTKKIFTRRERAFGNRIEFYPEDLIFMSIDQKIRMVELLSPTGALFENQKRAIFGMPPIPELDGKRLMSLNWIDADRANEYQIGTTANGDNLHLEVIDEEKEEV